METAHLKILHFYLQNIKMCLPLSVIIKVLPLMRLHAVPTTELVGVINLSGESVPIIDLAFKLNINRLSSYTIETPILLCKDGHEKTGFIVDQISHLTEHGEEEIQVHHELISENSPFIGVIKDGDHLSLLLDYQKVLTQVHHS